MEHSKLHEERQKATFDVTELTILIEGGEENVAKRKQHEKYIFEDDRYTEYLALNLGLKLEDICTKSLEIAKYFNAKMAKIGLPGQFFWLYDSDLFIRNTAFSIGNPLLTHESLFVPAVVCQSNDEQRHRWLSMIKDQKLFGTYSQTELGHGDNIQAIETTATYDRGTKEFVINSPTKTSIKCYAAGLARSSTHAVVMAKLIIDGKNYGLHLFMVQLRSLDDLKPLKGITVGCMGPKLGLAGLDNGYLHLNHVRIPREDMLMKNAKVMEDGSYVKLAPKYSNFSTLSLARVTYSGLAWSYLSGAVTIAVRYSAVRQQGSLERGKPEVAIIEYQTQQYKLLPPIAIAYVFLFAVKRLNSIFKNVTSTNIEAIAELHALSSGMKAVTSHVSSESTEICRRACGGIGYLEASGLPNLLTGVTAICTYEGDNTVLLLQTAGCLMKLCTTPDNLPPSAEYLFQKLTLKTNASAIEEILHIFKVTSSSFVQSVYNTLSTEIVNGVKEATAWSNNTLALEKCAYLHTQTFIMQSAYDALQNISVSDSLRQVLEYMCELVGIYWILQDSKLFVTNGRCFGAKIRELNSRILKLLTLLRPNAVALVDAFDIDDNCLRSVIGCYDGKVYERVIEHWKSGNLVNVIGKRKKANL